MKINKKKLDKEVEHSNAGIKIRFSILGKFLVLFSVIFLIVFISLFIVVLNSVRNKGREEFYNTSAEQLDNISAGIELFMDTVKYNLNLMSEHPVVKATDTTLWQYLKKTRSADDELSDTEKSIRTFFKYLLDANPEYVDIFIGSIWGGYVAVKDNPESGYDPRVREWYKKAMDANGEVILTNAYLSTIGDFVVGLSRQVSNSNGKAIGVVTIEIKLDKITEIIANSTIGKTGYTMLTQKNNMILADPKHPNLNTQNLADCEINDYAKLAEATEDENLEIVFEGESWLVKEHIIEGLNWKLFGLMQSSEFIDRWKGTYIQLGVIQAAFFIVALTVISIFIIRIIKPLKLSVLALKDISEGEGDLTVRLPVRGNDELTQMAAYFNKT
ncbi:MAG: cache domain-containing protein, partial [Treponemataceae bacterium]